MMGSMSMYESKYSPLVIESASFRILKSKYKI